MNIESIKEDLLVRFPLFANVIASSNFIADENVHSVSTDGKDVYYNPDFMNSLTEEKQKFAIAHILMHIAFNHLDRAKDKDHMLWNFATNAVINAFLKKEGLKAPENIIDMPQATNCNAEELYNELLKAKDACQTTNWDGHMYSKLIADFIKQSDPENKDLEGIQK